MLDEPAELRYAWRKDGPASWDEVRAAIEELACLPRGWNNPKPPSTQRYDGSPLSDESAGHARTAVDALVAIGARVPTLVALSPNGVVRLAWSEPGGYSDYFIGGFHSGLFRRGPDPAGG